MVSGCRGRSSNLVVESLYVPVKSLVQIIDRVVGIKLSKMLVSDTRDIESWIDRVAEQALAENSHFARDLLVGEMKIHLTSCCYGRGRRPTRYEMPSRKR